MIGTQERHASECMCDTSLFGELRVRDRLSARECLQDRNQGTVFERFKLSLCCCLKLDMPWLVAHLGYSQCTIKLKSKPQHVKLTIHFAEKQSHLSNITRPNPKVPFKLNSSNSKTSTTSGNISGRGYGRPSRASTVLTQKPCTSQTPQFGSFRWCDRRQ